MTTLILIILAIIAIVLTIWFLTIPAEVVAGTFKAFRHGDWKHRKPGPPRVSG
ncbi:hypothetical protein [Citrifermentans bremense]|uniref:hypothetical protein n=1 Tax=Citrifermentans bremense TaxID=60035 RepID=UPI0018DE6BCE|nr:hypothetical protein [Citrifermentans bremense]